LELEKSVEEVDPVKDLEQKWKKEKGDDDPDEKK
jgi:hypothetical protein